MKVGQVMERIVLWLASIAAVAISLAHLLGYLEKGSWLEEHIPTIGVLLLAGLLPALVEILDHLSKGIHDTLRRLQESHDRDLIERLSDIRKRIDPTLEAVFGDHIANMVVSIERAVREQYVELHDVDLFRAFYKRTLSAFPKSMFFATSLPRQKYFWKNPQLERAMRDFTDHGGAMKRIFFLRDAAELDDDEVRDILTSQLGMRVEVYIAHWHEVPQALRHFFVVESEARLAWEAEVGPSAEIEHIRATCDPKVTQHYIRDFKELLTLETTRRYEPIRDA